jgi:RNA-directed DNA polymerase
MNTADKSMYVWETIPWRKLERSVFKLQKRIYQASQRGDVKTVHKLQRLLIKSWSAKCLAVRRVTQENRGKKTAGVDGIKSLTPIQRLALVKNLKLSRKSRPTRRVWIPKPGTKEKRPLGIPTMADRALQALVKLALEPEWEAKFEPNSYGFRPGRSCHDAVEAIFNTIRYKPKFVLDADIAKCFDSINHEALLRKLNTSPTIRHQIKAWLKAGVIDWKAYSERKEAYSHTSKGTPQGGVIFPLLANIALHGLENRIIQAFPKRNLLGNGKTVTIPNPAVIRYADDFVILHEDISVVQRCQQIASDWLKDMGLELKPSKTHISHTVQKYEGNVGFNFLGFNARQYPQGKNHSGKNTNGQLLGFKTLIKPNNEAIKRLLSKTAEIIGSMKAATQPELIKRLNLTLRGWANYYSTVVSKDAFAKADHLLFSQLKSWAEFRHHNKGTSWVKAKYWKTIGTEKWVFTNSIKEARLLEIADTPILRYTKVKGNSSPFDGNWVYWSSRLAKYPSISKDAAFLLRRQKGKCNHCGLNFKMGDVMEIHHIDGNHSNSKNSNLAMLHGHCHDHAHSIWLENEFKVLEEW